MSERTGKRPEKNRDGFSDRPGWERQALLPGRVRNSSPPHLLEKAKGGLAQTLRSHFAFLVVYKNHRPHGSGNCRSLFKKNRAKNPTAAVSIDCRTVFLSRQKTKTTNPIRAFNPLHRQGLCMDALAVMGYLSIIGLGLEPKGAKTRDTRPYFL